jgi:hypothetical protein
LAIFFGITWFMRLKHSFYTIQYTNYNMGGGNIRDVRMKPIWGLFWAKELKLLKIILVSVKAGILLMHQPTDPLHKELLGLLLEPMWGPNMEKYMKKLYLNPHTHIEREYLATVPGHILSVTHKVWCPNTDTSCLVVPLIKTTTETPKQENVEIL